MAEDAASSAGPVRQREGLRIVPPHDGHTGLLVDLGADEEARRWGDAVPVRDATAARAWVDVTREAWAGRHRWAPRRWVVEVAREVTTADTAAPVWRAAGTVEYRPDGHGGAEVGYAVHPAHRGRGVATRALDLALGEAFEVDDVVLARWRAEVGHWASRRVAWRLGFSLPQRVRGLLPGWGDDTEPRDGWVASLRRDEPRVPAYPWLQVPVLDGGPPGVRLRPWRDDEDDAVALTSAHDPARELVGPVLPGPGHGAVADWLTACREEASSGTSLTWCVADARTDEALGVITVRGLREPFAHGCAELVVRVLPAGRDAAVLPPALRLVVGHATTVLGLHRLTARTDERDRETHVALEAAGFRWSVTEPPCCGDADGDRHHGTARFALLTDAAAGSGDRAVVGRCDPA